MTARDYITGIDISNHQRGIDFRKVWEAGHRFVYVKATEGVGFTDPSFFKFWEDLQCNHGPDSDMPLLRGAYSFARPDSVGTPEDAREEAAYFSRILQDAEETKLAPGVLPGMCDFERYSDNGPEENVAWLSAWVTEYFLNFGANPGIYTGDNIWRYELGDSDEFVNMLLWQVFYSGSAKQPPNVVPGWDWTFWQFSGGGKFRHAAKVDGRDVDVNFYRHNMASLQTLAGIKPQKTSMISTISLAKQVIVNQSSGIINLIAAKAIQRIKDEAEAAKKALRDFGP